MSAPPVESPDLAYGQTWPALDAFGVLARDRRVIPVVRRLMADAETPVGVYRKLAGDRPGTFLLESAEHGGVWSRWSIVGAASRATLTERDGQAYWVGDPPAGVPTDGPATEALRATMAALATAPIAGLPPLTGGMVGAISYDAVRQWERVPQELPDELGLPELAMMLATDLAVLDHADGSVLLVANAVNYDGTDERVEQAWADAVDRLDAMTEALAAPAPSTVAVVDTEAAEEALAHVRSGTPRERYEEVVELAKEDIRAGEVFQVVLSQRFSLDCPADPLEVYRALRAANPSPYMYLFRFPAPDGSDYAVVGSSPEALVRVTGERAITHPIAGSRPRGKTPEEDVRLAEELLADPKERAEHVMLVDLGRNDLQRVCRPGTVDVVEFMDVRRYSHVIHLESTVVGDTRPGASAFDVLVSTFPAGTLSGAPKPRALALIERYEPTRRGIYGGVVGYLDVHGDLDMAIAIRTAVIRDGVAHVQAGAGIVADSVPAREHEECLAKAAAALRAVATAGALRTVP
ncbi:anthranilate synthase component I [Phycicoccus endophyticus]|uniref:Anthranilate synthase component 1 n=1 Tax=Phycicoccus endophyticus TaxID=1690220 RepID=A0A7G9R4B0_9MICO|nr:anthranilate synthase component I [Phycicoccus endophyticus]NHI18298.1 anthranilate synthase component I [Phycicoccus endophyticus]QNN50435.1 anthranilate synthase component I [Phycicoccus endophyticus]GGL24907.1 anthranilate synthase component I [Phycicoccus endophyticus]